MLRPQFTWDPEAFNFYKANPREFLLSYTPSFRRDNNPPSVAEIPEPGSIGMRGLAIRGGAAGGTDAQDEELISASTMSPILCEVVSTESPPQDALLVNIKPVGLVSLLLTPG